MDRQAEDAKAGLAAVLEGFGFESLELEGSGYGQAPDKTLQRVTSDTLALAGFILPLKDVKTLIELGTGTGALALIAARSDKALRVTGVELHPQAAACAAGNVRSNFLEDRVEVVEQDWRGLYDRFPEGAFDLVVSNPPYIKKGTGRVSPNSHRALARHESAGTLAELVDVAAYLAGEQGCAAFVYPTGRFCELLGELQRKGLVLRRLAFVYTLKQQGGDEYPGLFLVEFGCCGGFRVERAVFI